MRKVLAHMESQTHHASTLSGVSVVPQPVDANDLTGSRGSTE